MNSDDFEKPNPADFPISHERPLRVRKRPPEPPPEEEAPQHQRRERPNRDRFDRQRGRDGNDQRERRFERGRRDEGDRTGRRFDRDGDSHQERPPQRRRFLEDGPVDSERPERRFREERPRREDRPRTSKISRAPLPKEWHRPGKSMPPERKGKRRAASQQSIKERLRGKDAEWLMTALKTPKPEKAIRDWTHGFHTYPGRFHPNLPRTLLRSISSRSHPVVMDPFMGGGTVLLEGLLRGHRVIGNDLNPVAQLVAQERCRWLSESNAERVWGALEAVRERAETRGREEGPIRRPYIDWLKLQHPPHLFVEMLHWIDAIDQLPSTPERDTLRAVFSSLIVKFSTFKADTSLERVTPKYPRGAVARWMTAKTQELLDQQMRMEFKLAKVPQPTLLNEDARTLPSVAAGSVHCIITSPPYPGTYDYFEHHLLRMKWLQMPTSEMKQGELGAKRNFTPKQWKQAFRESMLALRRSMVQYGHCYLVLGDWLDHDERINGIEFVRQYAPSVGWEVGSAVSLKYPLRDEELIELYGEAGRWEHLIQLQNPYRPEPEPRMAPEDNADNTDNADSEAEENEA
ncbi:MAG: DNA adenine methylase [SAR324 cluster bacterium]|nr:DNA adenine methylase [SAR324 cluster bacterium]